MIPLTRWNMGKFRIGPLSASVLRVTLLYFVFATLWIYLSGRVVVAEALIVDSEEEAV
ncbi:MAG: hypothetical protein V1755_09105 [Chloroflexota bacterium]